MFRRKLDDEIHFEVQYRYAVSLCTFLCIQMRVVCFRVSSNETGCVCVKFYNGKFF